MTKHREPPGGDDDDSSEFRRAMADVRRLPQRPRVTARPKPHPVARHARAERADVLRESLIVPADPAALDTGEHMSFRRAAVREETLRKLKRGQFSVEAEIDLHGLGRHAAHEALRQFLNDCVVRGLRCVRVIHGKGLRSGPGGPVLKHVVNHWLRKIENVAAFASARPVDGGTGAVYVLLAPAKR
jgi:DNA-nicking Smr family endonuclease